MQDIDTTNWEDPHGLVLFTGFRGKEALPNVAFYMLDARFRAQATVGVAQDGQFRVDLQQLRGVHRVAIGPKAADFFSVEKERLIFFTPVDFYDQLSERHVFSLPYEVWSNWPPQYRQLAMPEIGLLGHPAAA